MKAGMKAIKIGAGSMISIMIAYAFGLDYAVSAGIITILSIQDTKKETIVIVLKRITAFIISVMIAAVAFGIFSFSIGGFGFYLLIFSGICLAVGFSESIPVNAVLATHFLLDERMTISAVSNEAFLMVIGAGIGVILNLFIASNVVQIRKKQREIEHCLKALLFQMADDLVTSLDSPILDDKYTELKSHVEAGVNYAKQNKNNTLFQESEYFIKYMEMRFEQLDILKEIIGNIKSLNLKVSQSYETADWIRKIANSLSESQNSRGLLAQQHILLEKFREDALPETRAEFETRAVLYGILMNLRLFLIVKKRFADALTKEQIQKYWEQNTEGSGKEEKNDH